MDDPRLQFLATLESALAAGSFVKLTLGAPCGPDESLRNVRGRVVDLRAGPHLQLVWRHDTRDVTRNVALAGAVSAVEELLGTTFRSGHLFTEERSWQLDHKRKGWRLSRGKATAAPTSPAHDREKKRAATLDPRWMTALGVLDKQGRVRRGMEAKRRQIHRFTTVLSHLLDRWDPLPESLRVVDMGCGKGLLTFATWQLLTERGVVPAVTGVELRTELATRSEQVARDLDLRGLQFVAGSIHDAPLDGVDMVVALHACNTATDDALARGVHAQARVLVVAPCCHQELRPQLVAPEGAGPLLEHGIVRTRQAELLTDTLRASLLEAAGYRARVFEFVSAEHTDKNLMITAERAQRPTAPALARSRSLARMWGVRSQHLADRLNIDLYKDDRDSSAGCAEG